MLTSVYLLAEGRGGVAQNQNIDDQVSVSMQHIPIFRSIGPGWRVKPITFLLRQCSGLIIQRQVRQEILSGEKIVLQKDYKNL